MYRSGCVVLLFLLPIGCKDAPAPASKEADKKPDFSKPVREERPLEERIAAAEAKEKAREAERQKQKQRELERLSGRRMIPRGQQRPMQNQPGAQGQASSPRQGYGAGIRPGGQRTQQVDILAPGVPRISPDKIPEQVVLMRRMMGEATRKNYGAAAEVAEAAMKNNPADMVLAYSASQHNLYHAVDLAKGPLKGEADRYFTRSVELARLLRDSGAPLVQPQLDWIPHPFVYLARRRAEVNDTVEAMALLDEAGSAGYRDFRLLWTDPAFAAIRPTPEFQELLTMHESIRPGPLPPEKFARWVQASHIMIQYAGARGAPRALRRTKDEARQLIHQIRARAVSFEAFTREAIEHSEQPDAAKNKGELGVMPLVFGPLTPLPPIPPDAIARCRLDEVSEVLEYNNGFHLVWPLRCRMYVRLIKVSWQGAAEAPATVTRSREDAKARARECYDKLKGGGDFAELAREYSDDITAPFDGKLGEVWRRELRAPGFVDHAGALSIGEYTGVFETKSGFHIVGRYDPRE